jgi:hypothetical protein
VELWQASQQLMYRLALYTKPESFEEVAMLHQAVRGMTASHLARWQGRNVVTAKELYCGADCADAFTTREFEPVLARRILPPAAGVWCTRAEDATPEVQLQDGTRVDVTMSPAAPFVLRVGGSNAVDAIKHDWVRFGSETRLALVILDTKHVMRGLLAAADPVDRATVDNWEKKRKALQNALRSSNGAGPEVLGVLVSRAERHNDSDAVSEWLKDKPWTCVISASGERLPWGLSPILAYTLQAKVEIVE